MRLTLRTKLTVAVLAVSLLVFVLMGVFANVLLERQFAVYVSSHQEQMNTDYVQQIASSNKGWGGGWDAAAIETIGMRALEQGLILRVTDDEGAVVWDAALHNGGMCKAILDRMAANTERYRRGSYTEKSYPLLISGTVMGTLTVGYYGPYFYNDSDRRFLGTLNQLLLVAAGVSALLSLVVGGWLARRITSPIAGVVQTVHHIAEGRTDMRAESKSNTKEVDELAAAVNALADRLAMQETLRRRLTADVAHELRTPLAALQSHLEAMIDGIWKPERDRLESCHEETMRLAKMVGSLEDLTRYESEALELDRAVLDVAAEVRRLLPGLEAQCREKEVALAFTGGEEQAWVDADALRQIALNLISNAIRYTQAGGTVTVTVAGDADFVSLQVSDTGAGIAAEDLPHVFERFYRTDRSRTRGTGGFGIGLAIVKSLVDAHGGRIEVVSELGLGSTFTVFLPREEPSEK